MRMADSAGVFYYLTDRETAVKIAEVGFLHCGQYNRDSTVTLLDRVPSGKGGGIVRVALPAAEAAEVLHREASDHGEGYRKFLVPMELLTHAYAVVVNVAPSNQSPG